MRRVILLALSTTAILLTACPSPPKNGECKSSADCASQAGFGKVCVSGRCAECGADADCKAGFVCKATKCEPSGPSAEELARAEAARKAAEEEAARRKALGLCNGDADCDGGKTCQAGKCAAAVDPACSDAAAFTVRFAFDQAAVTGDAPATLQKLAGCLQKAPAKRIQVDGHCDDRGTTAYNLALGKRRAEAVKKYLGDLGVAGALDTNTYGEEKPLCREATESCWARNRRAEFTIER
jgi:peptidoglycan-associated lipoprotein